MFQYTKEVILNKVDKDTFKIDGDKLIIAGVGEYYIKYITTEGGSKPIIHRTEGKIGECAKLTLPLNDIKGDKVLSFKVVTDKALGEFANATGQVFSKPIIVGYNTENIDEIVKAIDLAIPEGNKFITVEKVGSDVVITGGDKYISFEKAFVTDDAGSTKVGTADKNDEPFATKEWLVENLRFPTYANLRYNAVGNMPTQDIYNEYSFAYAVPREGLGGLSGVGQGITAVTRHIVYVPQAQDDGLLSDQDKIDVETSVDGTASTNE